MRKWLLLLSLLLLVGCTAEPATQTEDADRVPAAEVSTLVLTATNVAHSVTWQFSPERDPLVEVIDPLWDASSGEQGVNPTQQERWVRLEGGTGFAQRGDEVWYLGGKGESEGPFAGSLPQLPFMQAVFEIPAEQFGVLSVLEQYSFRRLEKGSESEVWVAELEPLQTRANLFGLERALTSLAITIEDGRPASYEVRWWADQEVTVKGAYTWAEPAFPRVGPPKLVELVGGDPLPLFTYESPADLESRPILGGRYLTHPPTAEDGRPDIPFVVALHEADGTELWRWNLGLPTRGIFYVRLTPSHTQAAVVEGDWTTHVINLEDGALITTLQPQKLLGWGALTRVYFVADGAYLVMRESDLASGEYLVQLYSVATGERVATYSGTYTYYWPYSELIVRQNEQGLELYSPVGLLGRLERPLPPDAAIPLVVSGDSSELLLFTEAGVEVYNRNFKPVERYPDASYGFGYGYQSKVLWEKTTDLTLRAWSPEGALLSTIDVSGPLDQISVLPSGALWVVSDQQRCLISVDASPFGCFDRGLRFDDHYLWFDDGEQVRVYQLP